MPWPAQLALLLGLCPHRAGALLCGGPVALGAAPSLPAPGRRDFPDQLLLTGVPLSTSRSPPVLVAMVGAATWASLHTLLTTQVCAHPLCHHRPHLCSPGDPKTEELGPAFTEEEPREVK